MRSDAVRKGMQQAPHRSLFNALGHTEEEMRKPLIGIVSSYNEIVPGHMNLLFWRHSPERLLLIIIMMEFQWHSKI